MQVQLMTRYFVPAFLLLTLLCFDASAATLFGRVVEVNDGDVITVFNLNRPVRIKLLAVDAPERDQTFGDLAKKHLTELVYDKSVLVEYSGIASDGSLVGRVTLNSVDVGAQMIRDGAAWFDASNQDRLSASDREVYQQSELAARNEKRGLWQGENPIAPWEFVRAKTLRTQPSASLNAVRPATKTDPKRPASELTNLTLISARMNEVSSAAGSSSTASSSPSAWAGRPAGPPKDFDMSWATDMSHKEWHTFRPAGENFSVDAPLGGKQMKVPVATQDGTADLNLYLVRDGWTTYQLMWITAPSFGETDESVVEDALGSYLKGVGQGYQSAGGSRFSCEVASQKQLSVAGYAGNEFDMPGCTVPARLRVFTKVVNSQRQMYIAVVFYPHTDPNVSRFIQSFTVSGSRTLRSKH
jgi:endonuclease YncB( thermonuclease family)